MNESVLRVISAYITVRAKAALVVADLVSLRNPSAESAVARSRLQSQVTIITVWTRIEITKNWFCEVFFVQAELYITKDGNMPSFVLLPLRNPNPNFPKTNKHTNQEGPHL